MIPPLSGRGAGSKSGHPEKFAKQIFRAMEHWRLEQSTRLTLWSIFYCSIVQEVFSQYQI
jgi:hypothetical protein